MFSMSIKAPDVMVLIGLAGTSCAGKNEVEQILERLGWLVIDADAISRSIFACSEKEILQLFSSEANKHKLQNEDGSLNKRELSSLLFSSPSLLTKMEEFILPKIVDEIEKRIDREVAGNPHAKIALNAPTLHKTKFLHLVSYIIYVRANLFVRFIRALNRDGFHPLNICKRFFAQRYFMFQYMSRFSDILVVDNNLSVEQLEQKIKKVLESVDLL